VQELNQVEIDDVSGAKSVFYYVGYYTAEFIQWSRVPADEWAWSGGG